MTQSTGKIAEQIRSAVGRKARNLEVGSFILGVIRGDAQRGDGAFADAADRIGTSRTRLTQMLTGGAGFWLADVFALEPAHQRAILEVAAEVCGFRLVPIGGDDGEPAHLRTIQAAGRVISRIAGASADGRYSRDEATPCRAEIRHLIDSLNAIDREFAAAEVKGVHDIYGGAA